VIASWKPGAEIRYHSSLAGAIGTHSPLILSLDQGAFPFEGFAERFLEEVEKPDVSVAYSAYETDRGTHETIPFNGDFTERFPFGPVRAYSGPLIAGLELAGFPNAWEYHARLILEEKGLVPSAVDEPLYFHGPDILPRPDLRKYLDSKTEKRDPLYSDSFAYLQYPAGVDSELREVFFQMLRRRCAFLPEVKPAREFPGGRGEYPVMASVLLTAWNRQDFISDAVRSALDQDYYDYEVMVLDNSSEDGTRERVMSFQDPKLRLVQHPRGSIAFALNTGLKEARGKYILQLDSDDAFTPETVRAMVEAMEADPGCGLSISYYQLCNEDLNPMPNGIVKHAEYDRNNILRCDGAGAVRCWRKSVLDEIGGFDEEFGNYGEDYDAVLKVSERYRVNRVHQVLYLYRRHPGSQDFIQPKAKRLANKTRIRLLALERRKKMVQHLEG